MESSERSKSFEDLHWQVSLRSPPVMKGGGAERGQKSSRPCARTEQVGNRGYADTGGYLKELAPAPVGVTGLKLTGQEALAGFLRLGLEAEFLLPWETLGFC